MNLYKNIVLIGFVNIMFNRIASDDVDVVGIPYMALDGKSTNRTNNMYELGRRLLYEINQNSSKYANLDSYRYNVLLITDSEKDDIDMSVIKRSDDITIYNINKHFIGFDIINAESKEVYVAIRKSTDGKLMFTNDLVYNSDMTESIKLVDFNVREIINSNRVKMTWDFEEALLATLVILGMHGNKMLTDYGKCETDEVKEVYTILFKLNVDMRKLVEKYYNENTTITGFQFLSKFGSLSYLRITEVTYRAIIASM